MQEKGSHGHKGGRGVIPLPPLFYFFKWGVPTPPCAGQSGGHPPGCWPVFSRNYQELIRLFFEIISS
jgi:hypothetical protein